MAEDDPDFMRYREPVTGMSAKVVAAMVRYAQRTLGGEIVSPAGAGSPDAAARIAVNNVQRMVTLFVHHRGEKKIFRRAERAVHLSETFCVAVSLTAQVQEDRQAAGEDDVREPVEEPVAEVIVLEERRLVPAPRASAPDRQAGLWEVEQELRLF